MKANSWVTYRTRFLVKAKQLSSSLTFTDVLGRRHSGSKGDYLVESSEGVLSIAPRQIFEDIYVPLQLDKEQPETSTLPRKAIAVDRPQENAHAQKVLPHQQPAGNRHAPLHPSLLVSMPKAPLPAAAARTTAS